MYPWLRYLLHISRSTVSSPYFKNYGISPMYPGLRYLTSLGSSWPWSLSSVSTGDAAATCESSLPLVPPYQRNNNNPWGENDRTGSVGDSIQAPPSPDRSIPCGSLKSSIYRRTLSISHALSFCLPSERCRDSKLRPHFYRISAHLDWRTRCSDHLPLHRRAAIDYRACKK